MGEKSKAELFKKLMQHQGDDPTEVDLLYKMKKFDEKRQLWNEIRSWIAVSISFLALIVSILVLLRSR